MLNKNQMCEGKNMFENATAYIDKLIEEKKLPLLDVVVKRGHEEIYRHYGAYNSAASGKELLCMFSCTKVLTAVSAMRLVEEGKIALEDSVSKYIPQFKNAYTLTESGEKKYEDIKVWHLFTMSSGLDYKLTTPQIFKLSKENYENATTLDVILSLLENPLHFEPGERFLYSLSHDALGALVEVVSGLSLAEYMQKYIFDPLGMKNSTMYADKYVQNPPTNHDIIEGYTYEKEKGNTYKHFHPTKNYMSGGAGLISTVEDFSVFAETLASGGTAANGYKLIGEKGIELLKTPVFDALDLKNNFTCVQGTDYAYGMGVRVRTKALECGIPKGEFGWDGAAGSYILVDTDNGISITMGLNILNWPQVFAGENLAIAKLIYEEIV